MDLDCCSARLKSFKTPAEISLLTYDGTFGKDSLVTEMLGNSELLWDVFDVVVVPV